ncbi:hypothetical protein BD324DRAFT_585143 [Kockovaella imperatae]|uniref:DNA polymerase n=1 Tax=Kockovaella imperatae TaxID=4999 RepID=A0A1Y1U7E8_9TREE|nr:hypothetical protein BD324DRAFT_585143 [Kockovaella imperatae]ORX33427.1 hypothetical protein BD324DRAFT_585143 [Kockovaella imperatae]
MTTQEDPEANALLRLRITHITSTMSPSLPTLAQYYCPPHLATAIPAGALPHHLPVLRIFGTTPALQKICANIHLCYPYFFVPFPMDSNDPLRPERVIKLCQRFAVSLNHAICLAMRQNPTGTSSSTKYGGGPDPRHLHVASVMLVKGVPFYGYHIGYSYFLKVSLVNPSRMYVAMEQLRKPVVLGREWQPHEAHMNHVLQFMCDFDLYGCGWLDLGGGTFREPLPEGDPYTSPPRTRGPPKIFDTLSVPADMLYSTALSPPKDTFTPLEIDVLPHHILNRNRLKPRYLHHDLIELLHKPLDPDEKLVPAVAELWEDERRRRSTRGLSLSERAMMPGSGGMGGRTKAELGYLDETQERPENKGGNWKISTELWDMIEERMEVERRKRGKLTYEKFSGDISGGSGGEKRRYDKWIMTTFQAVSAHWPRAPRAPKSTQRSKKSRISNGLPSSPTKLASSTPVKFEESSPLKRPEADVKPDLGLIDQPDPINMAIEESESEDEIDFSDSDEENPFEALVITQLSQGDQQVKVEVDDTRVTRGGPEDMDYFADDLDEEQLNQMMHERDARQHAEESAKIHATQAAGRQPEGDEYDDEELDELFRNTVGQSWVGWQTPRRRGMNGSVTPSSASKTATTTGGLDSRRAMRDRRIREMAGLGDLSTIMDRSSMSLSSPGQTPVPQTPTKTGTGSTKTTPTSLSRNIFAKHRPTPVAVPKQPRSNGSILTNTVVLAEPKKILGAMSSSPEEDRHPETPTRVKPRHSRIEMQDVKPDVHDHKSTKRANTGVQLPPARQPRRPTPEIALPSSIPRRKRVRLPSPTLKNPDSQTDVSNSGEITDQTPNQGKRVRLASPESGLQPTPQRPGSLDRSIHSQESPGASGETRTSTSTDQTQVGLVEGSSSTVQPDLSSTAWQFQLKPPDALIVRESVDPEVVYQDPYYSNPSDVPSRPKMFAGRMFALKSNGVNDLADFESSIYGPISWMKTRQEHTVKGKYGWAFTNVPPRRNEVTNWCSKEDETILAQSQRKAALTSQLRKPTQKSRYGFKFSQRKKTKDSEREHQNMSVLAVEVFAKSRHQLLPDPEKDEIVAVFFCYQNEDETLPDTTIHPGYHAGYVIVESAQTRAGRVKLEDVPCHYVASELDLINWVIDTVKFWDPDVLAGWELHNSSWGYIASRANEAFSIDLMEQLSRVVSGHSAPRKDFYSATHASTFKVSGRHVLNIWRICRSEITLIQYTFENVVFHLMHQRIPHYPPASLTALWKSKTPEHATRVLKYFFQRAVLDIEIVDAAEIITKNAEFARVFGVDFASVMFRGSQYKVESFMFRIAKPESFVLVSPSKQQVGLQNAPFAVPLIAEPESKYYNHPILVLDFQSLYPSVMIAYNICFSTCLGRVEKFKGTDKFGFTELKVADGLLELLKDYLTVTPNGMIFVKPAVRKSLLAKMLGEILDTRVMVKHAMKGARGDKSLTQLLNARQLGLKLMANVTYGYTSATYSGRMPCIEVADSIVQTGRETLEKAQEMIHSRADWRAQVVYGDTDSLFVALPGRSKDQAFRIGNEIADAVTAVNPKPVKLKFEKVYMGSVLMAKKRYVGFKYEHPDEIEPVFDAKGIETIRRDGFPAQSKIEEVCLKMLFRNQDLSEIKEFCRQEWTKILQGRVSMQDFIVAKEVRLGSYSDKGVPPPGAAVAYRRILKDPRDEPQYAERVPYIVSNTEGRRLIDRARMPEEMLANRSLGIDAEYYIRNLLIPPLSRIFNLVGADVEHWYESMPRTKRASKYDTRHTGKMRIDSHFKSSHCIVCGGESSHRICSICRTEPSTTTHALLSRQHLAQQRLLDTHKICASCSSTPVGERILCDSIDCPVTYARVTATRDVDDLADVPDILEEFNASAHHEEIVTSAVLAGPLDW